MKEYCILIPYSLIAKLFKAAINETLKFLKKKKPCFLLLNGWLESINLISTSDQLGLSASCEEGNAEYLSCFASITLTQNSRK